MRIAAAVLLCAWCGCGAEPAPEPVQATASSGAETAPQGERMEVSGLMGTIPERKIHATLEPKLPSFQRCFMHGAERVEMISGSMQFYFRVGLDGQVEWVYPRASTVGDRPTEQCLLEVAKAARFPEPKGGGAAEISWGFELDASDAARPPVAWDEARVQPVLATERAGLQACGVTSGALLVTAYVAPGGQVLAAGASAPDREAAERIDCVVGAVQGWHMPDPGSYPAKVSFHAP
ncbi:MAG: AgmX/PglI C-terminal domain-containing protein [Polyangiales bacterium]